MKYFRLDKYGIEWCPYEWRDKVEYHYYFYPVPHWLRKDDRYIGYEYAYYDGEHHSFGFWYFNISWNVGLNVIKHWICQRIHIND